MKQIFIIFLLLPVLCFSQRRKTNSDCISVATVQGTSKEKYFIDEICRTRDWERIKTFLDAGVDVNIVVNSFWGIEQVGFPLEAVTRGLHYNSPGDHQDATTHSSLKLIEELLKRGANPNIKICPVYKDAIAADKQDVWVDNLFNRYMDGFTYNETNYNALFDLLLKYKGNPKPFASKITAAALSRGFYAIVDKVIDDADMKKYPYMIYALENLYPGTSSFNEQQCIRLMTKLLDKGANINHLGVGFGAGPEYDLVYNRHGTQPYTPFAEAIRRNLPVNIIRFMVSKGAVISKGALGNAIVNKNINLVKFLVEEGKVDINEKYNGDSIIYLASKNLPQAMDYLILKGAQK